MRRLMLVIPVLVVVTTLSGCLWAPDLDRVRKDIERQLPGAHFEREFAISLGPLSLGLAKMITAVVPPAREARDYLREIRQVKVAVYKADNVPDLATLQMPERLSDLLGHDGWEIAVKVRENNGEAVWILYRSDGDVVKELYVVVLSDHELVLVRAAGNIDKLAIKAMREHHRGEDFDVEHFF